MKYPIKVKEQLPSTFLSRIRSRLKKILILTLLSTLVTSVLLAIFIFFNSEDTLFKDDFSSHSSPISTLMSLIKYDFSKLQESDFLPDPLLNVKQIQFKNRAENLIFESKDLINFIKVKPSGKFFLTVEFYPFPEEEQSFLVQFNWIEIKSKNKVWEMNRVYKLKRQK